MGSGGMAAKSAGLSKSVSNNTANTTSHAQAWSNFQKLDSSGVSQFMKDRRNVDVSALNRWSDTQRTVAHLGMHDKPVVLDNATWDSSVKTNALDGVHLWRGVTSNAAMTAADVIYDLKFGKHTYIGDGIHGDGLYFTTKFSYAQGYSNKTDGSMAKAYIDKSKAKVITEGKLERMRSKDTTSAANLDLGSYALYKGYNVIHIPGGNASHNATVNHPQSHKNGGQDFYNVLDRSVLVIRDTSK